jgi:hypothetical protein
MTADGFRGVGDTSARDLWRFRITVALAAALPIPAGCQTSMRVNPLNRCGYAVEARADSVKDTSVGWTKLEPDQRSNIVAVEESAKELYVTVRVREEARSASFTVAVADLPKPPKGVDDDVEIVLEGDRCPASVG